MSPANRIARLTRINTSPPHREESRKFALQVEVGIFAIDEEEPDDTKGRHGEQTACNQSQVALQSRVAIDRADNSEGQRAADGGTQNNVAQVIPDMAVQFIADKPQQRDLVEDIGNRGAPGDPDQAVLLCPEDAEAEIEQSCCEQSPHGAFRLAQSHQDGQGDSAYR